MMRRRSVLMVVLAVVAGVLPLGLAPVHAAAAPLPQTAPGLGSLGGTVFDENGTGLDGLTVDVLSSTSELVGSVESNPDGSWLLDDLAPGDYVARVTWEADRVEWHPGVSDPANSTVFTVAADAATSGADFHDIVGGSVSGHVTRDGAPPVGGQVIVRNALHWYSAPVQPDGSYTVSHIRAGTYQVFGTSSNKVFGVYGAHVLSDAPNLVIAENSVITGIDMAISLAGSISGSVSSGIGAVDGATVQVFDSTTGELVVSTTVNGSGTFTTEYVVHGSYSVSASINGNTAWYGGGDSFATAATITHGASPTDTTGIGVYLPSTEPPQYGALRGNVTRNGQPATAAYVQLYDMGGSYWGSTSTDMDGAYVFGSLPIGGTYRVMAAGNGATAYYGGASLETATPVTIVAGTTSGIDIDLPPDVILTGTVTRAGQPVEGASIAVYAAMGMALYFDTTDADGSYSVALAAGSYKVQVTFEGASRFIGGLDFWQAGVITVTGPSDPAASGNDIDLPVLGSISGTLTRNGVAVTDVMQVFAAPTNGMGMWQYGTVSPDGSWTISGLEPGSYRIGVYLSGAMTSTYYVAGGTATRDQFMASTVTVDQATPTVSGVQFALPIVAQISGSLTRNGVAVTDVMQVFAAPANGMGMWQYAPIAPDGSWTISGLDPGSYRIGVSLSGAMVTSYYVAGGTATRDQMMASTVTVDQATPTVSGIQFALPIVGSISGTLTRNDAPLTESVQVFATPVVGMGVPQYAMVGPDGSWTINGLDLGSYRIGVFLAGMMSSSWYRSGATATLDQMAASSVTIDAATPSVTGIQFALPIVGEISGRVMSGSVGVPNAYVVAVQNNCTMGCSNASAQTDADGRYVIRNVPAAGYIVYTMAGAATQYFHGGTSAVTATVLQVSPATPVFTDVDIALPAGRIEGTLTYRGQPVPFAYVSAQPISGMGGTAITDANGHYSILGLNPGEYAVYANGPTQGTAVYGGGTTNSPGARVSITPAAPVSTGVDIVFGPGELRGVVTRNGQPVSGAIVIAVPGGNIVGSTTTTDMNGAFVLRGIPTTTVKLAVRPTGMGMGMNTQPLWYGGASEATATSITLAGDPPEASGIVFEVPTGRIDLTVTNGGVPYTVGYAVLVRADAVNQEVQQDSGPIDGFSMTDLPPGDYKLRFHTSSMFGCGCTWVGGSSFDTAQVITVGTSTVALSLELGLGTISGSVALGGVSAPNGGQVMLYSGPETTSYTQVYIVYLNPGQSTFSMTGVPAGTYSVKFTAQGWPFFSFWAGGTTWANADRFALTPGGSLTNVVVAPPVGSISGRVTNSAGQPLAGVSVQSYTSPSTAASPVVTDADGRYTIPNLGAGTYFMLFSPPSGVNSVPEWSGDVVAYGETQALASTFVLGDDEALTGVDAQLDDGGRISGCITDTSGAPIPNVYVNAGTLSPQNYLQYIGHGATSGTDGCYELMGLGSGNVQLNFAVTQSQMLPQFEYVLTEYWDGAYEWTGATLFPLALGQHVTGKNAVLEHGARGTSTITLGGTPLPFGSAGATFCKAPGVFVSTYGCSDGSGPIWTSGEVGPLSPGTWNVRAARGGYMTPLELGPVGQVTVGEADVFTCVVPVDATPTCSVLVDDDGVPASVEADAPNSGDGNDDGVPDGQQDEVASVPDPTGGFVTVESVDDLTLADVSVVDPATVPAPPANVDPQSGLVAFTVPDLPPALSTVQIKIFLPVPADSYWKYDPVNGWVDASSLVTFSPDGLVATITLTDGAFGDQDGVVNGTIVDPGVFALTDRTQVPLSVTLSGGSLDEGTSLVLQPTVTGAAGAVTTSWDLGADGSVNGTEPMFTISAGDGPQTITVSVQVGDGDGRTATATATFTVVNVAPAAGDLVAPARVKPNKKFDVSVNGLADVPGDALTVAWDCGSGVFGAASTLRRSSSSVECRAPKATGTVVVRVQITDDDGGVTVRSASVQVRVPTKPGAPTNLVGTAGPRRAVLSWSAPADDGGADLQGYVVEMSSNGGRSWSSVEVDRERDRGCDDDVTTTLTSVTVTGLRSNTTYSFRVRAVNEAGAGAASGTVSVKTR